MRWLFNFILVVVGIPLFGITLLLIGFILPEFRNDFEWPSHIYIFFIWLLNIIFFAFIHTKRTKWSENIGIFKSLSDFLCEIIWVFGNKTTIEVSVTPELLELKKKAIDGMVSYMKYGGADSENDPDYDKEFKAGYTQKHIDQCSKIIDEFLVGLANISDTKKNEAILKIVKVAVVKLNRLNNNCDGSLIETDQREALCDLIISAAKHAGLKSIEEDITEEWREW